jgi:hypothetical protein
VPVEVAPLAVELLALTETGPAAELVVALLDVPPPPLLAADEPSPSPHPSATSGARAAVTKAASGLIRSTPRSRP